MIEVIAENEAKREIRKQTPLLTFEEFADQKRQTPDFFLKPVAVSAIAETAAAAAPPREVAMIDAAISIVSDPPATTVERGEAIPSAPEPVTQPTISEPAIELVSELPPPELEGDATLEGMV